MTVSVAPEFETAEDFSSEICVPYEAYCKRVSVDSARVKSEQDTLFSKPTSKSRRNRRPSMSYPWYLVTVNNHFSYFDTAEWDYDDAES